MFFTSVSKGIKKGLHTTWTLAKIVIPVYVIVTILKYTPVLNFVANIFRPFMKIFNLPGEAVLPLVFGNLVNLYAGTAAMGAIDLTPMQITTIAVMLSFSHSMLVETAVTTKLNAKVSHVVGIRVGLAIVFGILVGQLGGALC
ncbi:MAG: nucleoside recognition protein [Anaeromicrobium sp.]|jgi:spore maturation protein SpmB|uniref:nucleoside recognition domain-containing protein n=1 Tax=Anaeromicrobium sp. TaxID=1929132 RepID=UPI0025ECDE7C|nr:nucleoside recognition domain-containing protein [Anaeromicrobium sp.]MCT4593332.1 nucleoside recognition protein [Anaeromicrobium sp.]